MENEYYISTDTSKLDVDFIHKYLSEESYWAKGRNYSVVLQSIKGSFCFGVYNKGQQVGFARVVTDYAVFAWIMDVFILEDFRTKGLGKALMNEVLTHPKLKNIQRWGLATAGAHGLYEKFGFNLLSKPQNMMEKIMKV